MLYQTQLLLGFASLLLLLLGLELRLAVMLLFSVILEQDARLEVRLHQLSSLSLVCTSGGHAGWLVQGPQPRLLLLLLQLLQGTPQVLTILEVSGSLHLRSRMDSTPSQVILEMV